MDVSITRFRYLKFGLILRNEKRTEDDREHAIARDFNGANRT